ncbi:MAG: hypothetical protein NT166_21785 [Candidatus Aminicenantes bacterium]|nr:hypothetical protein [Candidatus Aminicenantes bacterium]
MAEKLRFGIGLADAPGKPALFVKASLYPGPPQRPKPMENIRGKILPTAFCFARRRRASISKPERKAFITKILQIFFIFQNPYLPMFSNV